MWKPITIILVTVTFATELLALDSLDLTPVAGDSDNNCPDKDSDCVAFYLCTNGSINTNGEGVINIRQNDAPCSNYLDVCCNKNAQASKPLTTTPPPAPSPKGCGYGNPNGVGFKITGDSNNEAQFGEFPWMVGIIKDIANPSPSVQFSCGGSLIHPQVVITAAHCVSNKSSSYIIRAGEWDINNNNEPYAYQDKKVTSIKLHPQFFYGTLYNDIAFLYLKESVTLAEHISLICLPPQGTVTDAGRCYSTGWGKNQFGEEGTYQKILKKIDLPQVPNDKCKELLRKTRLGREFELFRSFMCAGGEKGRDTCKGDGGSPLVCPIQGQENRYYQAGIVAWGIGCGEEGIPGVYTDVSGYREWIDEQMVINSLDTTGYEY